MAVVVRTCCCGCDLRFGVLLIGIFYLLYDGIYCYIHYFNDISDGLSDHDFKVLVYLRYVGMAFAGISELTNVSLLLSAWRNNRFLADTWVIWRIFSLIYIFALSLYLYFTYVFILDSLIHFIVFIVTLLGWLLSMYFIIVVYSYTENLRQDPSAFEPRLPLNIMTQSPPYERVGENSYNADSIEEGLNVVSL
ncbi:uncharacterized protein LOC144638454 [Oculina patagonica]